MKNHSIAESKRTRWENKASMSYVDTIGFKIWLAEMSDEYICEIHSLPMAISLYEGKKKAKPYKTHRIECTDGTEGFFVSDSEPKEGDMVECVVHGTHYISSRRLIVRSVIMSWPYAMDILSPGALV